MSSTQLLPRLDMLAGMHGESKDGPAIEFRDVSYDLPSGQRVLSDLNLQVQRGETLVFLGRSGSGKTTTLKLVNRLQIGRASCRERV